MRSQDLNGQPIPSREEQPQTGSYLLRQTLAVTDLPHHAQHEVLWVKPLKKNSGRRPREESVGSFVYIEGCECDEEKEAGNSNQSAQSSSPSSPGDTLCRQCHLGGRQFPLIDEPHPSASIASHANNWNPAPSSYGTLTHPAAVLQPPQPSSYGVLPIPQPAGSTMDSSFPDNRRNSKLECSSVRGQSYFIGIMGAIVSLALLLAYGIMQLPEFRNNVVPLNYGSPVEVQYAQANPWDVLYGVEIVVIGVVLLFSILVNLMLVHGCRKESRAFLLPWLCLPPLVIVCAAIAGILMLAFIEDSAEKWFGLIPIAIAIVTGIAFLKVLQYYKQLSKTFKRILGRQTSSTLPMSSTLTTIKEHPLEPTITSLPGDMSIYSTMQRQHSTLPRSTPASQFYPSMRCDHTLKMTEVEEEASSVNKSQRSDRRRTMQFYEEESGSEEQQKEGGYFRFEVI